MVCISAGASHAKAGHGITLILLLAGFVVLGLAGEALLRGAVTLADKLRVSPLIIGLTIIAFGTSALN